MEKEKDCSSIIARSKSFVSDQHTPERFDPRKSTPANQVEEKSALIKLEPLKLVFSSENNLALRYCV